MFENLYLSIYSISHFCTLTFTLLTGLFLLRLRTTSTLYLGWTMLAFVPFFGGGYFLAFSWMEPLAAFHRWFTVFFILLAETLMLQFFLRFPENVHATSGRRVLFVQLLLTCVLFGYFVWQSLSAPIEYQLRSHNYDFILPGPSMVIGSAIITYLLVMILTLIYKWKTAEEGNRKPYPPLLLLMTVPTMLLALLNVGTYLGIVGRDLFGILLANGMILIYLGLILIYLNHTRESTTLVTKIIGITVISFLAFYPLLSTLIMRTHEAAFFRQLQMLVHDAVRSKPAALLYLARTNAEGQPSGFLYTSEPWLERAVIRSSPRQEKDAPTFRELTDAEGRRVHTVSLRAESADFGPVEAAFPYLLYRQHQHEMAALLLLIFVATLTGILFFFPLFFRGSILIPLRKLMVGVQAVNQGDLSTRVELNVQDELGLLAGSFNTMVESIREAQGTLEERVISRTAELKTALDKLQEMDELKTNFFANISHELRTPLTLILSPLESLLSGEIQGPAIDAELQSMHRNSQKLLNLINNLLDFSRLEAGRMDLQLQRVDLLRFTRELLSAFDSAARQAGLELKLQSDQRELLALIDPPRMEKVILNLLSNAFKFTKQGSITVHLSVAEDECQLQVTDTGTGIPADSLESIFERFSQVDGSASRRYEGTGIGLALARELAQLHGGTLTATSILNEGSTFTLRFPIGIEMAESQAEGQNDEWAEQLKYSSAGILAELVRPDQNPEYETDAGHTDRRVVLLVEDTADMRRFIASLLEREYRLIVARNGREGLEAALEHRPDLILSDVMMPEMNGYELLCAIRQTETLRATPVILITAKADLAMKIEGLERGADDYIVKPFNSRELVSRIRSQLRMVALQKEVRIMRDKLLEINSSLTSQMQLQISDLIKNEKLHSYLPEQLVARILSKEKGTNAVQWERKKLTIFFSDIVDFTRITEDQEPEELAQLLNSYLSEMTVIARQYGGIIDKFIGDAILIHFGAFDSAGTADDARQCTRMAIAMQQRMQELDRVWQDQGFAEGLRIRCGINTGFAACGNFGSTERMDYTIIGSQVNLASRIQTAADPGGILMAHSTRSLVKDEFHLEDAGMLQAKGFYKEHPVYRVLF